MLFSRCENLYTMREVDSESPRSEYVTSFGWFLFIIIVFFPCRENASDKNVNGSFVYGIVFWIIIMHLSPDATNKFYFFKQSIPYPSFVLYFKLSYSCQTTFFFLVTMFDN